MKSSLTKRQTNARGLTYIELLVSMGVVGIIGMVMFGVLEGTMKLSSMNAATNISNYRMRQALDRLVETAHYGLDTPVLLDGSGAILPATTTTSDGIQIKNFLGASYVFLNASGNTKDDITKGSTSFVVQYAASANNGAPSVGDYFLLASSTAPELEVATVGKVTTNSGISSVPITTKTAIQETVTPSYYTVTASRYRKESFIFVQAAAGSPYWTLRHYGRIVAATDYKVATTQYTALGTGFEKLGTNAWFTIVTDNGTQATWLRALVRSSSHAEYAENLSRDPSRQGGGRNTATIMPLQIKLWNYNAPPPAAN